MTSSFKTIGTTNNKRTNIAATDVITRLKPYRTKIYSLSDTIKFNDNVNLTISDNLETIINISSIHKSKTISTENDIIRLNPDLSFIHNTYYKNEIRIPPVQIPGHQYNSIILDQQYCKIDSVLNEITINLKKSCNMLKVRVSIEYNNDIQRYYLNYNNDYTFVDKNRTTIKIYNIDLFYIIISEFNRGAKISLDYISMNNDSILLSLSSDDIIDNWLPITPYVEDNNDTDSYGSMNHNKTTYNIKTNNADVPSNTWNTNQYVTTYGVDFAFTNSEKLYGFVPFGYNHINSTNMIIDDQEITFIDYNGIADSVILNSTPNSQLINYMGNIGPGNFDPNDIYTMSMNNTDANMSFKKFNNSIGCEGSGFINILDNASWVTNTTKYIDCEIYCNHKENQYKFKHHIGSANRLTNYTTFDQFANKLYLDLGYTDIYIGIDLLNDSSLNKSDIQFVINNNKCDIIINNNIVGTYDINNIYGEPMITISKSSQNSINQYTFDNSLDKLENVIIINDTLLSRGNGLIKTTNISTLDNILKSYPYYKFNQSLLIINNKSTVDNIILPQSHNVKLNDTIICKYNDIFIETLVTQISGNIIQQTSPSLNVVPELIFVNNAKFEVEINNSTNYINCEYFINYDNSIIAAGSQIYNQSTDCIYKLSNIDDGIKIYEFGSFIGNTIENVKNKSMSEVNGLFNFSIFSSNPKIINEKMNININYFYSYIDNTYRPTKGIDYFTITNDVFGKNRSSIEYIRQSCKNKILDYEQDSFVYDNKSFDNSYDYYITYMGDELFNVTSKFNSYGQFTTSMPYKSQVNNAPFDILIKSSTGLNFGDQFVIKSTIKWICDANIERKTGNTFNLISNNDYIQKNNISIIRLSYNNLLNTVSIYYFDKLTSQYLLIDSDLRVNDIISSTIGLIQRKKISNIIGGEIINIDYNINNLLLEPSYSSHNNDDKNAILIFNYFSSDLPDHIRNTKNIIKYVYDEIILVNVSKNNNNLLDISLFGKESNISFVKNDYVPGDNLIVTKDIDNISYELFDITINIDNINSFDSTTLNIKTVSGLFSVTNYDRVPLVHQFALTQSERIGFLNENGVIGYINKNLDYSNGGEYYILELEANTSIKDVDIVNNKYLYNNSINFGKIEVKQRNSSSMDMCKSMVSEKLVVYYDDNPDNIYEVINTSDIIQY